MFWGLIMEPGRCYTQKVKVSFHVAMAALDISNSTDEPAQVMCVFEGRNYLLCTLKKRDMVQCPLDLNFEAGTKVSFATNGNAHVHLTGYLTNFDDDSVLDTEEEQEEETAVEKKRPKKEANDGPPTKKSKKVRNSFEEVEDEGSSDSDFEKHMAEEEDESDDDYDEEIEEEEEEDEEEAEDEEASSLSDKDEEPEEKQVKPKQNGITKNSQLKEKKEQKVQEKKAKKLQKPKKTVLKGGVMVEDVKEGTGDPVKEGKFVHVYYEGRLKDNNKVFDSTTKGPGFSFRVGKGEVIKGWDIGLVGMKVGGKRRITCPPKVGYGQQGSPPVIPPNSTLIFDVELKKVS